ncbi:hypothetical protein ACFCW2_09570 [Qipengyuania sp. DSG2-2]|uniref:hypothetical protein n=1 Tax=Qipengyuania sp. DGS2-2 TaxID=3349631 RepID=UPI0036D36725
MRTGIAILALPLLAACQPEVPEEYVERVPLDQAQQFASEPAPSPDVTGAVWAEATPNQRLLYGIPGQTPMLALACERSGGSGTLTFTRYVAADAKAKALMALVGNFHVARIPVDATWNGRAWLWQGSVDAANGDLEVMTGPREVELTIPGAGSLMLGSSPLPGDLVTTCRTGMARPSAENEEEADGREDVQETEEIDPEPESDATPQAEVDLEDGLEFEPAIDGLD